MGHQARVRGSGPAAYEVDRFKLMQPLRGGGAEAVDACFQLLPQVDVRLLTLTGPGGIGKTRLRARRPGRCRPSPATPCSSSLACAARPAARGVGDRQESGCPRFGTAYVPPRPDRVARVDSLEHVLTVGRDIAHMLGRCPRLKCWRWVVSACGCAGSMSFRFHRSQCQTRDAAGDART